MFALCHILTEIAFENRKHCSPKTVLSSAAFRTFCCTLYGEANQLSLCHVCAILLMHTDALHCLRLVQHLLRDLCCCGKTDAACRVVSLRLERTVVCWPRVASMQPCGPDRQMLMTHQLLNFSRTMSTPKKIKYVRLSLAYAAMACASCLRSKLHRSA